MILRDREIDLYIIWNPKTTRNSISYLKLANATMYVLFLPYFWHLWLHLIYISGQWAVCRTEVGKMLIVYSFGRRFLIFPLSVFIVGIFYQTIRKTQRSEGSIPCISRNLASMLCKSTTCVCVHVSYVSYRRREKMIVYSLGRHFLLFFLCRYVCLVFFSRR